MGMAEKRKMVLVVGLGRFGLSLCEKLAAMGQYVVGVDADPAKVEAVADIIALAAQLDATDEDALIKVGAKEADIAVVTIGENIEASILATTIIKGFNIPLVVARAQTALHARVLSRVGAHRVIFPERDMGQKVAEQFVHPWLSSFSQLPGVDISLRLFRQEHPKVGVKCQIHQLYQGDQFHQPKASSPGSPHHQNPFLQALFHQQVRHLKAHKVQDLQFLNW
jgi:Trk K+ transport system NAD-binding subunit